MTVDGKDLQTGQSRTGTSMLNANGKLYVGGAQDIVRYTRGLYATGFNGCLANSVVLQSTTKLDLRFANEGRGVQNCN